LNNSRYLVHIVRDQKFIDMAYREFEYAAPGRNRFVIIGENCELRHVRKANVEFRSFRSATKMVRSADCAAVVLHSLPGLRFLRQIPSNKTVIWLGWGFDYYGRLLSGDYPNGLILPLTKSLIDRHNAVHARQAERHYRRFRRALRETAKHCMGITNRRILTRIDYFIPVLDMEYERSIQLNPWFRPGYFEWNYATAEDDFGGLDPNLGDLGSNILVGNSADPLNNHLEAFRTLDRYVDLTDKKIIVPLSYGKDWYRKEIVEAGNRLFGNRFIPLTEYLDATAYIDVLQSCGFVLMNHLRQQGMGNICIMMLKGASIFLHPRSPAYTWFLTKGCAVQNAEALRTNVPRRKRVFEPLESADRKANSNFVMNFWGRDAQRRKTRQLIDIALRGKI
jgi:hypothetical protein